MLKELTLASALLVSSLSFATNNNPENWVDVTNIYVDLMDEYLKVCEDTTLTQVQKAEKIQEISEKMASVNLGEGEDYLNKDYNDCMRESNKQHDKDMDRCDKNETGDKCYDRADKNNDNRRAACERVSHSDNARDTASSRSSSSKKSSSSKAGDRR
jgi:hypothetical protein